jgi:hypothetical protein
VQVDADVYSVLRIKRGTVSVARERGLLSVLLVHDPSRCTLICPKPPRPSLSGQFVGRLGGFCLIILCWRSRRATSHSVDVTNQSQTPKQLRCIGSAAHERASIQRCSERQKMSPIRHVLHGRTRCCRYCCFVGEIALLTGCCGCSLLCCGVLVPTPRGLKF